ncbi:hypothetical protein SLEP1_g38037 [Rubroshorea leprosula]|uniref:RBR-type E3 ubiquitin transferase n=1 Tax=Rubroshorea leprosula TaxID=152421 RepID=A0AAV5KX61_9ROSI|nr:hypothetical protein SLEP1_g38037 [Rubroshorea leprosula]
MDLEDDFYVQDYNNESGDDGSYGGADDEADGMAVYDDLDADGDDYGFVDYNSEDSDENVYHRHQQNYTVLNEAEIRQRQEDDIMTISTVLFLSKVEAAIILRYYNWNVNRVHEEWFADEENVRKAVGLLEKPTVRFPNGKEMTCGICFDAYPCDTLHAAACGHPFCESCWTGYISTAINDGPGCLMLRCPDPPCRAAVGQDMINAFVSDEDIKKYSRYLIRSYIEDNKKTKWCPAPGCDYAVDFIMGSGNYDVTCLCNYGFCWNCTEEAHRPVACGTVSQWILKNSAESENMNW